MKTSYVVILLVVTSLFLGCVDNTKIEKPSTAESIKPGIFKSSELNNLPKVIDLGNNIYLTLKSIDKNRILVYTEYNGIGTAYVGGQFIFRDKEGRVVQNGNEYINDAYTQDTQKTISWSVDIPLDLYETWEPRIEGFSIKWIRVYSFELDKFTSSPVELEMNDVSLSGTIEKNSNGIVLKGYIDNKGNNKKIVSIQLNNEAYLSFRKGELDLIENMVKQPTKEFSDSFQRNEKNNLIILEKGEKQQITKELKLRGGSTAIKVQLMAINQI